MTLDKAEGNGGEMAKYRQSKYILSRCEEKQRQNISRGYMGGA
jgi:hypothetical protein